MRMGASLPAFNLHPGVFWVSQPTQIQYPLLIRHSNGISAVFIDEVPIEIFIYWWFLFPSAGTTVRASDPQCNLSVPTSQPMHLEASDHIVLVLLFILCVYYIYIYIILNYIFILCIYIWRHNIYIYVCVSIEPTIYR